MGILLKKGNKKGEIIDIENYSEILKFEILEYFSNNISNFIKENNYQNALKYVENQIGEKFEIPLRIDNNIIINDKLNTLIINEKSRF